MSKQKIILMSYDIDAEKVWYRTGDGKFHYKKTRRIDGMVTFRFEGKDRSVSECIMGLALNKFNPLNDFYDKD